MTGCTLKSFPLGLPVLAVALALSGCGGLVQVPTKAPPNLYRLSVAAIDRKEQTAGLPLAVQLVVDEPNADDALNSRRIAIREGAFQFKYLADARWVDNAPRMVQTLLIESFENSGRIVAIGRQTTGLRPDYVLRAELRDFQGEVGKSGDAPMVHVRLNLKLLRVSDLEVVAFTNAEATERAASARPDDLMPAFDRAASHVLQDSVQWVFGQVGK